jgi:lysozyme
MSAFPPVVTTMLVPALALALLACGEAHDPSGGASPRGVASTETSPRADQAPPPTPSASAPTSARVAPASASVPSPDCVDLAPGAAPAPAPGDPRYLHGVDASSRAAWKTIREAGYEFAFAQVAFGATKNAHFEENWRTMKACGLVRGAYHFLTPQQDGAALARTLLTALEGDWGELPPTIDLEKPPGCEDECCEKPCSHWRTLVRTYLAELGRAGHERVLVYLVEPFFNQCLCGTRDLAAYPLFLAAWPKFDWPEKVVSGGFGRWTFYQHKGNVRIGGGVVDLDVFRGTREELLALSAK